MLIKMDEPCFDLLDLIYIIESHTVVQALFLGIVWIARRHLWKCNVNLWRQMAVWLIVRVENYKTWGLQWWVLVRLRRWSRTIMPSMLVIWLMQMELKTTKRVVLKTTVSQKRNRRRKRSHKMAIAKSLSRWKVCSMMCPPIVAALITCHLGKFNKPAEQSMRLIMHMQQVVMMMNTYCMTYCVKTLAWVSSVCAALMTLPWNKFHHTN